MVFFLRSDFMHWNRLPTDYTNESHLGSRSGTISSRSQRLKKKKKIKRRVNEGEGTVRNKLQPAMGVASKRKVSLTADGNFLK